ncbi:MAG: hypothetical protein GY909_03060 [Oligoflexia bacterium]|nr:hypothetical protein [Oligoflexia bacterium]
MKIITFLISLLLFTNIHAGFQWNLQVTDPEFELKNYPINNESFKPFLPKTSWRCEVSEIESKNGFEVRHLFCNYSIQKLGTMKTPLSCGPSKKSSEILIDLYDEKKDLLYKIRLSCLYSDN